MQTKAALEGTQRALNSLTARLGGTVPSGTVGTGGGGQPDSTADTNFFPVPGAGPFATSGGSNAFSDIGSVAGPIAGLTGSAASIAGPIGGPAASSIASLVTTGAKDLSTIFTGISALTGAPSVNATQLTSMGIFTNADGSPASAPATGSGGGSAGAGGLGGSTLGRVGGGIAGAAGVAAGVQNIMRGSARDVVGGAGEVAGGVAAIVAAIAPALSAVPVVGAIASAALGLVSSFLPDPRSQRANQISKTLFTQQYLAPVAQNITESGNGGYADVDQYGNVRTSNFSPYPIDSNPYLDVPRRVVVPGHQTGQFGGYVNQTGAQVPGGPGGTPPVTINVSTMDAASFNDNAGKIMDAVNIGLNSGGHELVHNMAIKLGLRS